MQHDHGHDREGYEELKAHEELAYNSYQPQARPKPDKMSAEAAPSNVDHQTDLISACMYFFVCFCTTLGSGGLIIGVGPFIERMVKDGYFQDRCDPGVSGCSSQYDALNPIFNGGFQIMTWCSCLAGLLLNTWGPRYNASLGLLVLTVGCRILATTTHSDSVYKWLIGYGMIGAGGNFLYISSFHFANCFQNREIAIGFLGGIFNLSGLIFMLLNIEELSIHKFFEIYFYLGASLTVFVFCLYPDKAVSVGERYRPGFPRASHVDCYNPFRELFEDEVVSAVSSHRFICFALLFAWCTLVNVVVGGLMSNLSASKSSDAQEVSDFNGYIYPALGNSTFLFTPLVGFLIQRTGFALPMLLNVLVTQICLGLCWAPGLESQYVMLLFFNLVQAFAYTLEFTYVQLTFPPAMYGPLIASVIAIQGLIGFIAWPGLSPNPFGSTAFTPVLLICLIPTVLLYYVPYQQQRHDKALIIKENKFQDECSRHLVTDSHGTHSNGRVDESSNSINDEPSPAKISVG
mmetsp:Transcript_20871/g.51169  ORF Transcript_20871/g.51169 Transcript_20871/m.51169 type:complete len:517 (-) Transcript_20871:83-1633(-)